MRKLVVLRIGVVASEWTKTTFYSVFAFTFIGTETTDFQIGTVLSLLFTDKYRQLLLLFFCDGQ